MTTPSILPATKGVTEALRELVSAVANMRVPQTTADAGVQVMLTIGPALTAAREALAKHDAALSGGPGLMSPEAIKNLIGMVRAEAASWREPESYEPRDAVEEAAFLDVIVNTLAALSPTAPELGAVKAHGMRLNEAHAAFHRACARSDALESTLRICRTFVISCRAEAKGCNQNRFDHTDELIGKIDEALAPAASQIDQPQTDEMQPDKYTGGDFNGVVRGKRP